MAGITTSVTCNLLTTILLLLHCCSVKSQRTWWPNSESGAHTEDQASALTGPDTPGSEWTPVTSVEGQQVAKPMTKKDFFLEVQEALGYNFLGSSRHQVREMARALKPMVESLEKNEYGNLGHASVRYALHRLFVARHGWLVKGLDPAGQHFNSSTPVEALLGKVPLAVQGLFEKRLGGRGLGIEELAVFATLLELLVSAEALERVAALYVMFNLSPEGRLTASELDYYLDLYMTAYILGLDVLSDSVHAQDLIHQLKKMPEMYSFWSKSQQMMRDVRTTLSGTRQEYNFSDFQNIAVHAGQKFGKWQNQECIQMKANLVSLEAGEKGCVPLSNFYNGTVASRGADWQYAESVDYLRQAGILDETDPQNMNVMLANYLNSPANCIAASGYYSVCCIDECQALLSHIEGKFHTPTVHPDKLAVFVAVLPSSTVSANRTLPPSQLHRLRKIAEKHGGSVPIHGRLFAQWMHMVYPRECAYPHVSGTTNQISSLAWEASTNKLSIATDEEMRVIVNHSARTPARKQGQCGQWKDEEELLLGRPLAHKRALHELETDVHTWLATASVALVCLLSAGTLAAIQIFSSMKSAMKKGLKKGDTYKKHPFMWV